MNRYLNQGVIGLLLLIGLTKLCYWYSNKYGFMKNETKRIK